MLRLIKRHLKACAKTSETDENCVSRADNGLSRTELKRRTKPLCPYYIKGTWPTGTAKFGQRFSLNTGTSDRRIAEAKLLEVQSDVLLKQGAGLRPSMRLKEAGEIFLRSKADRSDARKRKFRRLLAQQLEFLEKLHGQNPPLSAITKTDLDQFMDSWQTALETRRKERENLKQFWLFCADCDFIPKNVASRLKKLGTKRDDELAKNRSIPTFDLEETMRFFEAVDRCKEIFVREDAQDPDASRKTRAFCYLIKAVGFAIVDIVTLKPEHFGKPDAQKTTVPLNKPRQKTGRVAHTAVPYSVWIMLKELKPSSGYYFWSGNGHFESCVDMYRDRMKKLFVAAGVRVQAKMIRRRIGGVAKKKPELTQFSSATPHMWRHTLVRDLYVKDVPIENIADRLGDDHGAIRKFYWQFDKLRQQKALDTMREHFQTDPIFGRARE